jgi:hypothetical protein
MMKSCTVFFAAALVLTSQSPTRADISHPTKNPAGNFTPHSDCPASDGDNNLDPVDLTYVPPPQAGQSVLNTLAGSFPAWTFKPGASLNGTVTIEYYWSKFYATHNSGARIKVIYTPGAGDPSTLRWVQYIDTTKPPSKSTSPYIDKDPDQPTGSSIPFYFAERKSQKFTDIHFQDFSHREHLPTSSVKWQGTFYLVSWDGNTPGSVTVHDGFMWGWIGSCKTAQVKSMALGLSNEAGSGIVSWPTNSPGTNLPAWRLQSTTNLGGSYWLDLTNDIAVTNGVYQTILPLTLPSEFFRLELDTTGLVTFPIPAYVAVSPDSNVVAQSHEAYLYCRADGDVPITYQWYFDSMPILNATNSDLDLLQAQYTNQGIYSVMVSNGFGFDISDPAQLVVVQDTNPPVLLSVSAPTLTQIAVNFSEPVNPATSLNTANYQVQGPAGFVSLIGVTTSNDQSIVYLSPSAPLMANTNYLLRVSGIADFANPPNFIQPGSLSPFATRSGP